MSIHNFYEKMHNKEPYHKTVILYSTLVIFMGLSVFAWTINLKDRFSNPTDKKQPSVDVAKEGQSNSNIFSDLKSMLKSANGIVGKNQTASVVDSSKKVNSQTQSDIPDNFYKKPIVNLVPVE